MIVSTVTYEENDYDKEVLNATANTDFLVTVRNDPKDFQCNLMTCRLVSVSQRDLFCLQIIAIGANEDGTTSSAYNIHTGTCRTCICLHELFSQTSHLSTKVVHCFENELKSSSSTPLKFCARTCQICQHRSSLFLQRRATRPARRTRRRASWRRWRRRTGRRNRVSSRCSCFVNFSRTTLKGPSRRADSSWSVPNSVSPENCFVHLWCRLNLWLHSNSTRMLAGDLEVREQWERSSFPDAYTRTWSEAKDEDPVPPYRATSANWTPSCNGTSTTLFLVGRRSVLWFDSGESHQCSE